MGIGVLAIKIAAAAADTIRNGGHDTNETMEVYHTVSHHHRNF
jgi:hypothetical protein